MLEAYADETYGRPEMNFLQPLVHEHRLIRQYLDNLSFAVERLEHGDRPPKEFFENTVLFAREFVDGYHHFKEEHQMFVMLAQKMKGKHDAAIEALRYQHERGRSIVTAISTAIAGYHRGDERDVLAVLENTAALGSLLRQHINREDSVFYPMAKKELTPEEQERLAEEFRRADEKAGADCFDRNEERVMKMGGLLRG
jgi:hemerythrin-like domain-containing protein